MLISTSPATKPHPQSISFHNLREYYDGSAVRMEDLISYQGLGFIDHSTVDKLLKFNTNIAPMHY